MSNPTELPDLDKLEAYATSSKNGDWHATEAMLNMLDEDEVLALVAAARRAQPEGEAPQAELLQRLEAIAAGWDSNYVEDGPDRPIGKILREEFAAAFPSLAAQSQGAQAVQIFTCKDKRGEYELVGYSNGAGPKRGESIVVYRDVTKPDVLYHRASADFRERMEWLGTRAAQQAAAPGSLLGYIEAGHIDHLREAANQREGCHIRLYAVPFKNESQRPTLPVYASAPGTPEAPEDVQRDAERFRWIEENCRTEGGGHGFTVFVPVDHEDIGCGIDAAIELATNKEK